MKHQHIFSKSYFMVFLLIGAQESLGFAQTSECDKYPEFTCNNTIAQDLYKKMQCLGCHGALGDGNGTSMADVPPELRARNFQLGRFKLGTCDSSIATVIKKGGDACGLSATMHPLQEFADPTAPTNQPHGCYNVENNPTVFTCLAQYIRKFKK